MYIYINKLLDIKQFLLLFFPQNVLSIDCFVKTIENVVEMFSYSDIVSIIVMQKRGLNIL